MKCSQHRSVGDEWYKRKTFFLQISLITRPTPMTKVWTRRAPCGIQKETSLIKRADMVILQDAKGTDYESIPNTTTLHRIELLCARQKNRYSNSCFVKCYLPFNVHSFAVAYTLLFKGAWGKLATGRALLNLRSDWKFRMKCQHALNTDILAILLTIQWEFH
jgi:hypothetical protein